MSNNRPQDVADILEAMDTPTPNEVYEATREYDTNYIAAAAASKAHAAPGGGSQTATVTLNRAAIRALPTTDYELVAAPGAGKMIHCGSAVGESGVILALDSSTAYTTIDPTCAVRVGLGAGGGVWRADFPVDSPFGFFDWGSPIVWPLSVSTASGGQAPPNDIANAENQALTLGLPNGGAGDLIGGGADDTLTVTIFYSIVDLP